MTLKKRPKILKIKKRALCDTKNVYSRVILRVYEYLNLRQFGTILSEKNGKSWNHSKKVELDYTLKVATMSHISKTYREQMPDCFYRINL